ncbi:GGDEF domain-containing protein [Sulfurospirillum sp. T05]|uniref:diguanylate cyclase n=1 Tax=Sulfurospirillum tamanense TaxID=2813362 RepID=A0ABS2WS13_9BACT|nr:sensor domain-containing diguanylate cyclase [Sulfurospirillum tamanensis]MBN2964402.1 GGDEF domain-containing protein [Sulfurospirillum tamanensis]
MHLKYKVVSLICLLLISVSLGSSLLNYYYSLQASDTQLKERSLPLSIDNIYTEIQKHFIEPTLVSSMMAHDTFVKEWLRDGEKEPEKIYQYLATFKEKYGMFTTFLVSDFTNNYYHPTGTIDVVSPHKTENAWYYAFKNIAEEYEMNLDFNTHLDQDLIMFINYKILDDTGNFMGATGIGINISYVHHMLKHFRETYKFNVFFANTSGEILLIEEGIKNDNFLMDIKSLSTLVPQILKSESLQFEYQTGNNHFVVNSKYIPELNLFLFVEANTSDFTQELKKNFLGNLFLSLLVTSIVAAIIIFTINTYQKQLESLAAEDPLTGLYNRRTFDNHFRTLSALHRRTKAPLSAILFDIDNFKHINDTLGHLTGDSVLEHVALCAKATVRGSDILARWGGEEFALLFPNTTQHDAFEIGEKLRQAIGTNAAINALIKGPLSISVGVGTFHENDTLKSLFHRVDEAMLRAKKNGKNQTVLAL